MGLTLYEILSKYLDDTDLGAVTRYLYTERNMDIIDAETDPRMKTIMALAKAYDDFLNDVYGEE